MKRIVVLAGLIMLAGCGGSPQAVGENSADSIRTTAVGNVVSTIPSPTPTPETTAPEDNAAAPASDLPVANAGDTSNAAAAGL